MLEWKKESNYVIHESGFTIIVEEGSFNEPSSIQIKQSEGFSAIEQAKLLREGMEFVRSKTHVDSNRMTLREHKTLQMTAIKTHQKLTSGIVPPENNTPRITVKKTRKTRMSGPPD
jgi:hypothetical protein